MIEYGKKTRWIVWPTVPGILVPQWSNGSHSVNCWRFFDRFMFISWNSFNIPNFLYYCTVWYVRRSTLEFLATVDVYMIAMQETVQLLQTTEQGSLNDSLYLAFWIKKLCMPDNAFQNSVKPGFCCRASADRVIIILPRFSGKNVNR